jgi:hypothetical protein
MIDGNPSDIDVPSYSVTNYLTSCTSSNIAVSADSGASYSATISPATGYVLQAIIVTMGGTDITSTAVSGSSISIASVTGAIVITAVAQASTSYTNQIRISEALDSTAVYNNGIGYKNGYYTSVGSEHSDPNACCTGLIPYTITANDQPTDILYIKGYTGGLDASHTRLSLWTSGKSYKSEYNGFLASNTVFDVTSMGTNYYKLAPKTGIHHSVNGVGFVRFSFQQADGASIVVTKNELIT